MRPPQPLVKLKLLRPESADCRDRRRYVRRDQLRDQGAQAGNARGDSQRHRFPEGAPYNWAANRRAVPRASGSPSARPPARRGKLSAHRSNQSAAIRAKGHAEGFGWRENAAGSAPGRPGRYGRAVLGKPPHCWLTPRLPVLDCVRYGRL